MAAGPVESFKLQSESQVDEFLKAIFKEAKNRSMVEVNRRAQELVEDPHIRIYFISKAKEMLRSYGLKIIE